MHQNKHQNTTKHIPVLLTQVLEYLDPKEGESYLDLTAGYGGHASKVLEKTRNVGQSVLVDRDENAIRELRAQFEAQGASFRWQDFLSASEALIDERRTFDLILADLGVSSPHLNEVSRGFAITGNGPLDMRMDPRQELTAEKIVNTYREDQLVQLLKVYGEEPKARQIAQSIIATRPIHDSDTLAALASKAWPGHSRVHPATRTFQAIRIAVNDELGLLERSLPLWLQLLAPGGRIAIISFHSLEDRMVKHIFAEAGGNRYDAELRILTKSPVVADHTEIVTNPRARSAKLRAAVKIKT